MSTAAVHPVGYADLVKDLRHEAARAFTDLADWLAYLVVDGKRDRTLYAYTREVAPLLRSNPGLELGEFTADHINHELALKPERSRYITRSIYNGFFQWAEDTERIARNPMRGRVPKMRPPKRRPREVFTPAEVALLTSLPNPDGQLLTILFYTGLRMSECRNLQRGHIDLNHARLVVYAGKGDKDRIVGLPPNVQLAVKDLDTWPKIQRDEHLWASRPGGGRHVSRRCPISDNTFYRWWTGEEARGWVGVLQKAGITDHKERKLTPHAARHTFGYWLREQGMDLEERSIAMGHEDPSTTKRFYPSTSDLDVARKVSEIIV